VDWVHRWRAGVTGVALLALVAACGGGTTELTTADLERADAPARRAIRTATSLPATTTTTEQPPAEDSEEAEEAPATPQDPAPPEQDADAGEVAWRVVVDEPTRPDEPGHAFADIVTDRSDLGPVWARFGLQATFVDAYLERELLLVAGFGESSSCPRRALALDVADDTVTLGLGTQVGDTVVPPGGPWPEDGACTADDRARTLVLAVERSGFPEGAFDLVHDGGAFTMATLPLQAPPPASTPRGSSDPQLDVGLTADPSTAAPGDQVAVRAENRSDGQVSLDELVLDRWEAQRWRPAAGQSGAGDHPAISVRERTVEAGRAVTVAEVDTTELARGWYAVRARVSGPDGMGQARRGVFELR
jgi:hypothetical protein